VKRFSSRLNAETVLVCCIICVINVSASLSSLSGSEIILTASDAQTYDCFGYSVAIAGDIAVVGAYAKNGAAGAAYIFERNSGGANAWGQVKKITASDAEAGDQFGIAVDISGDVIIVGARQEDEVASNGGAAYIFERNSGGANAWGQVKKLLPSKPEVDAWFGISVSIAGDLAAVGAYREDSGYTDSGAAYVFERNIGGLNNWGQIKKMGPADANPNEWFGRSVAIDGNVLVVGANLDNQNGGGAGAAYVYERNIGGLNNWGFVKKLLASDGTTNDNFGTSAAISDDIIIVGAHGNDSGGGDTGAAYIFERNSGGANAWGQIEKITASDAQASNHFGFSVSINRNIAIVGAYGEKTGGELAGAAYVFTRNTEQINSWCETKKLTASNAGKGDYFGNSVAIDGDVALVGAFFEDTAGANAGAAYILPAFSETKDFDEIKKLTASDAEQGDIFGRSVAVEGDVIIIGAYSEDSGGTDAGAAYIYERNSTGVNAWGQTKKMIASDAAPNFFGSFGNSVALAGNVAVVGSYRDSAAFSGAAYIFERDDGGANTWGEVKKITASSPASQDYFGASVAIAGDVAVIGAFGSGGTYSGAAYIFERDAGGANTWGEVKKIISSDLEVDDNFGGAVAAIGDVAVVGAHLESPGGITNAGAVYIFGRNSGGIENWGQIKKITASDAQSNDYFGASIAAAGDLIVVGAYFKNSNSGMGWAGAAYIFERNAGGINAWGQIKKLVSPNQQEGDCFGWSVAIDNDIVAVGSLSEEVYVFERNAGGINAWGQIKKIIPTNPQANSGFGSAIAIAGDTVVISAPYYDSNASDTGAAYVFETISCAVPEPSGILWILGFTELWIFIKGKIFNI